MLQWVKTIGIIGSLGIGLPGIAGGAAGQMNFDLDQPRLGGPDDWSISIVRDEELPSQEELDLRAKIRAYRKQIGVIRRDYLGPIRIEKRRQEGLDQLAEFTDPAAFKPLIDILEGEKDDVLLFLLDHFKAQGEMGQAAVAWLAIHHDDSAIRNEARKRLTKPADDPVRAVIENALKDHDPDVANLGGQLAGFLDIHDAIPLLILAQADEVPLREEGDQAWIAIGQQRVFIQALIPVVGDNSGAFLPVPGVVQSGVVLRIHEAVAVIYRTEIHIVLVNMTSQAMGYSTEYLGYDFERWKDWYNNEYLPHQRRLAEMRQREEERERVRDDRDDDERAGGGNGEDARDEGGG